MKIVFFETKDYERKFFEEQLREHELVFYTFPLNEETADYIKDADIVSVFVFSKVNAKVISKMKNVKLIATRSTGYDHIDLEFAKKANIKVCNVPTYGTESVAEHTFALILTISRRIFESIERTRKGNFENSDLIGFNLEGKTLGIIGAGRIGRRVAEIAKAFKMRVIAYDIFKNEEEAKRIGFEYVDLDTLLRESDIITLHANLTKENYHMLNEEAFEKMKDGVIIINTARGALIDTKALIKYLKLGKVKACALDVLEEEAAEKEEIRLLYENKLEKEQLAKLLANHILIEMEDEKKNVLITPHNAFNSYESLKEILETTVKNIKSFIAGNPINLVC